MRELLAFGLVLLVAVNTVNSGAIYRRYRELELPAGAGAGAEVADAEVLPAENYVSELRSDQIPVQVVEVVDPVLVVKPLENLRSVEPEIALAGPEPAAIISNEIIPESLNKLEEELDTVRAVEQAVAEEQELPLQQAAEVIFETAAPKEEQQLRNLEPEAPADPAPAPVEIALVEAVESREQLSEDLPLPEPAEKKLLPEALPEPLPESLPQESQADAIAEEKIAEEAKPIEAELPALRTLIDAAPIAEEAPEVEAVKENAPVVAPKSQVKSIDEEPIPAEVQPSVKALKEDEPLIEAALQAEEEAPKEIKEEPLEEKKELLKELKEDKPEELKIENEEIKDEIKEQIKAEIKEEPKEAEDIAPSAKQADTAEPAPTTARPSQPGFIQSIVQNSPLAQLINTFNGNNQAAPEENSPLATATTFIQALQNTTTQLTNSIQQGFQQQLQSLQTTFTGQPAPAAADAEGGSTARPQGPLQSIVTTFLGNGAQSQDSAAAAQPQPAGPLQGILNLFSGNRNPAPAAAAPAAPTAAAAAAAAPAPEPKPEEASAEAAADESSVEVSRDSIESSADSQEDSKPDDIIVSDDDSHE